MGPLDLLAHHPVGAIQSAVVDNDPKRLEQHLVCRKRGSVLNVAFKGAYRGWVIHPFTRIDTIDPDVSLAGSTDQ